MLLCVLGRGREGRDERPRPTRQRPLTAFFVVVRPIHTFGAFSFRPLAGLRPYRPLRALLARVWPILGWPSSFFGGAFRRRGKRGAFASLPQI
jgi:hypothetical protein